MIQLLPLVLLVFVLMMTGLVLGLLAGRRAPNAGCAGSTAAAVGARSACPCARSPGAAGCAAAPDRGPTTGGGP
jgi:hypothetical protein